MRWLLAIPLLCALSCNRLENLPVVADTEMSGWREAAVVTLPNNDTLTRRNIYILVRYVPNFLSRRSVTLNVVTTTPSESTIAERVTLHLDCDEGRRGGDQTLREHPYRTNVLLHELGEYRVAIYPQEPIEGIGAVGIKLE